ncbi:MAG: holo-[acyl-carrier-protein] synthase [Clostridium sp. 26_21]|nr:MAG: holo-[acyl-carrier-protein] synthase [Clostridium sp. 26_21]
MKIRTGTDIIEISRVKESIESTNERFCERVYTEKEREYCENKKMQKYQHYAVRFSAKEAIFKAISDELDNKFEINWKDIEILNDEKGRPYVNILNKKIQNIEDIDISLSHCKQYAIANVVVIFK